MQEHAHVDTHTGLYTIAFETVHNNIVQRGLLVLSLYTLKS